MSSFWEQLTDGPYFCQTGCVERCRGEADDEEVDEEFARIVYQAQDERLTAATNLDEEITFRGINKRPVSDPIPLATLVAPQEKFSLPWADLNGNQKESLVTSDSQRHMSSQYRARNASPTRSLLPISTGSTGTSLTNLYRPMFVTGVPSKAYQYKPFDTDPIDVEVHKTLRALGPEASQVVALRRIEAGRYEIEGRTVSVYWDEGSGIRTIDELLVHEDEVLPSIDDMPLQQYITLVSNVAVDLQHLAKSESFFAPGALRLNDPSVDGDDRYRAMQVACMQAKIREEGAERQWHDSLLEKKGASLYAPESPKQRPQQQRVSFSPQSQHRSSMTVSQPRLSWSSGGGSAKHDTASWPLIN